MARKADDKPEGTNESPRSVAHTLAEFLAYTRSIKKLTLRDVEEATDREVSNAYLSQLETGKISRPSPNILHALARVYGVSYELLMEKAGYISPAPAVGSELRAGRSIRRRVSLFDNDNLTQDEQEKLLEYLAFLRSRRSKT